MARTGRDGSVLGQFRTLCESGAVGAWTDGQLLERFATGRGEVAERAFAALVERHGPMVLRVCRGVLGDADAAHDAFQATFLVLLRRSRGLWVRDSLAPWLHQVALRTAACARSAAARRRRHERRAAERAGALQAARDGEPDDWSGVLHQEIGRLPERYRVPVVLCDLNGRTHAEAARDLGWPVGTVKSRLARARERLRDRLIRRGVAPSAGVAAALGADAARAAVPASLVAATLDTTTRFATGRAAAGTVPAAVAGLARGVLTTMLYAKIRATGLALLVFGSALGAGVLALGGAGDEGPGAAVADDPARPRGATATTKPAERLDDVGVVTARTGPLRVRVVERGNLEATRSADLINEVEGRTTILTLKPEGSRVRKGEVVGELDSSILRDQLMNQEIALKRAEADLENAAKTREVAEIDLKIYEEGTFPQDRKSLAGQIEVAQQAARDARARRERTIQARERLKAALDDQGGAKTPAEILAELDLEDRLAAAELDFKAQELAVAQAERRLQVLEQYAHAKATRELAGRIEHARSDELAKQATVQLEQSKLEKLRRQIEKTRLLAPTDGILVYAEPAVSGRLPIEEGATVVERQVMARVVDLEAPMRVNARVQEAWVDQVRPGQKVEVRVDALPHQAFSGVVESVAPRPDPIISGRVKLYPTRVAIEDGHPGFRPGMTAEVRIAVADREQVLRIPVRAVVDPSDRGEKGRVAVRGADGGFAWRDVTLGLNDGEYVEVRDGLAEGDEVAIDPGYLKRKEAARDERGDPAGP